MEQEPPVSSKDPDYTADVVRLESNLDTIPVWAPSTHARELERVYPLYWRNDGGEVRVHAAGKYGQLRSFDKLVLVVLVHLWNQQKQPETGRVNFQIVDILDHLEMSRGGKMYQQVKDSLYRLKGCMIEYKSSFFDKDNQEFISIRMFNILRDVMLVEPKKQADGSSQQAFKELTWAELDFRVVRNLLGNYTRPVSLQLLQDLSERGILFESYINSVLYRHVQVKKDIYDLWDDLGLKTGSMRYGSQLASRMRPDLDRICADPRSLLEHYEFEKSKSKRGSQNLILHRRKAVIVDLPPEPSGTESIPWGRSVEDVQRVYDAMCLDLKVKGTNNANLRRIASLMPEPAIRQGCFEAWGRFQDGQTKNAARYFVGIMKNRAEELGVDLGLPVAKRIASSRRTATARKSTQQAISFTPQSTLTHSPEQAPETAPVPSEKDRRVEYQRYRLGRIEEHLAGLSEDAHRELNVRAGKKTSQETPPGQVGHDILKRVELRNMVAEMLGLPSFDEWRKA